MPLSSYLSLRQYSYGLLLDWMTSICSCAPAGLAFCKPGLGNLWVVGVHRQASAFQLPCYVTLLHILFDGICGGSYLLHSCEIYYTKDIQKTPSIDNYYF